MHEVTEETYKNAYKPFDIVTDEKGNVGFISTTNVNHCQPEPHQVSYSVNWLIGKGYKSAWYRHDELKSHGNMIMHILLCTADWQNQDDLKKLINSGLNTK